MNQINLYRLYTYLGDRAALVIPILLGHDRDDNPIVVYRDRDHPDNIISMPRDEFYGLFLESQMDTIYVCTGLTMYEAMAIADKNSNYEVVMQDPESGTDIYLQDLCIVLSDPVQPKDYYFAVVDKNKVVDL